MLANRDPNLCDNGTTTTLSRLYQDIWEAFSLGTSFPGWNYKGVDQVHPFFFMWASSNTTSETPWPGFEPVDIWLCLALEILRDNLSPFPDLILSDE